MELSANRHEITVGTATITAPYNADDPTVVDGVGAVVLRTHFDRHEDPDFSLPSRTRNVVAFFEDGGVRWTIRTPETTEERGRHPKNTSDGSSPGTSHDRYRSLFALEGSMYAVHDATNELYEVEPETGELLGSMPHDRLPLGGSIVTFESRVNEVFTCEGTVVVRTDDRIQYAFDRDGTERWRIDRRSTLGRLDDRLYEILARGIGGETRIVYRIDAETGDRMEKVVEGHLVSLSDLE